MRDRVYGILWIPRYSHGMFLGHIKEYIDLNFTPDINNEENICRYIEDVLGVAKYEIYWTFLDFDHFIELH